MSDKKEPPRPVDDYPDRVTNMKAIAANVKRYRNRRKMSLRDLGDRCGLARSQIGRMERGVTMPSLDTLIRVASALDVTVFKLLKGVTP